MKLSNFEQKNNKTNEEILKEKYDEYSQMNQEELSNKLFSEVASQKQKGTFDYNKLVQMVESLRGSIPEENYNNIKRILENLK